MDLIDRKLDMLITAPHEATEEHIVLDIKEASELIGKTIGTIYSLTTLYNLATIKAFNQPF